MNSSDAPGDRLGKWKQRTSELKTEIYALYLAYKDPRVPWYARVFAAVVAGYAFSPIDFIPDFIPVLGYIDDLILVPLGVWLALKMIPPQVMADNRHLAKELAQKGNLVSREAAVVIVVIWVALVALAIILIAGWIS